LRDREFLVAYKATILEAVREVDTARADYAAQEDRLKNLSDALQASQRSIALATERYDRGLTDFLNVLDAQRQEYDLEDQFAAADQQAADALVTLYKALGGGWEGHDGAPPPRRPLPAIVAAFDRLLEPSDAADQKDPTAP
jgi:outer membrane protein TolC